MKHVALVCKLMPLYRLPVFHELSKINEEHEFTCFGDTKQNGGIEVIPWSLANNIKSGGVNWIKTSNYFYITERLLWQTGIIKRIVSSKYKYFIFEGAVFHLPTWIFTILCRIFGKKALFWTHGFKGLDKGLKRLIRILYFKLPHGLMLYGNYSKKIMIEDGFDANKLFVIYNSLDSNKQFDLLNTFSSNFISNEKAKLFKKPELFTVIFIGRLLKGKNIPFLLEAVKDFSKQKKPINCLIIGDGPELDLIKNFISDNNLDDNFHLTGSIYDESEICKFFKMSDLMVSPGNVGLNCMHSLAYGVPVLTHNNFQFQMPEAEAINSGETGILFEYNNYDDLLLKLNEWINMEFTKEKVKEKCQEVIRKRYNANNQAAHIVTAVNSI